jgi:hypothetical protein
MHSFYFLFFYFAGVLLHILLSGTLPFLGTKDRLYECICEGKLYLATSRWQYISDHAKVKWQYILGYVRQ